MARPRSSILKYMISFTLSIIMLCIMLTVFLLTFINKRNDNLKEYLNRVSETASLEIAYKYNSVASMKEFKDLAEAVKYFQGINDSKLLAVIIFSRTEDENFFKVQEIIYTDKAFKLPYIKNSSINLSTGKNYIKSGLSEVSADPKIYRENNFFWQNVFFPLNVKERTFSVLLSVNSAYLENPVSVIAQDDLIFRKYIFISISSFIILTVFISLLYMHNLTLFINSLAHVVKKAVSGESKFKLNAEIDNDFKDLAYSFNNLISEMKQKDKKISELSEKDYLDDIFKRGVQMLKDDQLHEAESIFYTLSYLKPEGFGSYFNLGVINAKRKNYSLSLEMFMKAKAANPEHELTNMYILKVKSKIGNNAG